MEAVQAGQTAAYLSWQHVREADGTRRVSPFSKHLGRQRAQDTMNIKCEISTELGSDSLDHPHIFELELSTDMAKVDNERRLRRAIALNDTFISDTKTAGTPTINGFEAAHTISNLVPADPSGMQMIKLLGPTDLMDL